MSDKEIVIRQHNAVWQVLSEIVSLFLFFLLLSVLYYNYTEALIDFRIILVKFCLILWGLFVIFGYLFGEFSPTVSVYFGLNYRTQIIFFASFGIYLSILLLSRQTSIPSFFATTTNIFFLIIVWVYFNFIAPIIGLLIRRIFPVSAILVTDAKHKEQLLKWWGYHIQKTVARDQFSQWLHENSSTVGKIDQYNIVLFDQSSFQSHKNPEDKFSEYFMSIPDQFFADFINIKSYHLFTYLTGFHTCVLSKYPGRGIQYRLKRLIDYIISLTAFCVSAPLFLFIITCIKLDSPGPIFYRHRRLGRNMKTFDLLKLRTMYQDADQRLEHILSTNPALKQEFAKTFKLKNDPRITRIGKILRQLSIDELPQILNVIIGNMSLVGPRPIIEKEISYYQNYSLELFRVLPGVSGLWQTSGRTETTYHKRVVLDTQYVRSWSLLTDLKLLLKTIPVVISQKGAY
ncbi:MAG: sugar transferase [Candidatus Latescibacteria bacterium]|nr:sugar transferase [Candidatus Latescibacterota bacterium]